MSTSPAALAALHQQPTITFRRVTALVRSGCLAADVQPWTGEFLRHCGLDEDTATTILAALPALDTDRAERALAASRAQIILLTADRYPAMLKEIPSPPPLLYVRGNIDVLHLPSLAVVGTRQATPYGLAATRELVAPVARQGIVIVSGLAKGIDAVAHRTALECGAATVAVLGSGIDQTYPWDHRQLADDIVSRGGAVITEFPLGAKPERHHFPQRNRIISGLSKAVLLIEAGEKSGALITAKFAVDQNRDVLALPGPIYAPQSIGPHHWIQHGARLVTSGQDVLETLNLSALPAPISSKQVMINGLERPPTPDKEQLKPSSPEEAAMINILAREPRHVDELAEKSKLDTSVASATLALMEIKGTARHIGGMYYTLA